MKKALSFFAVLWCLASTQVWASDYDFSAVAPSGQTLYYCIDSNCTQAIVVCPNFELFPDCWTGYTKPSGNLIIPSTVSYDGTTLPVTAIGTCAFKGCSGLTSVTIPDSVTIICDGAFAECSGLTEIHFLNPVAPQLVTSEYISAPFYGVPSTIPVYIPCGSSMSYYSRWSYFSNFVEEEGFTFTATSANEQQGTVQILTIPTCTSPQAVVYATANSGYHFDHWSDGSTSNPYSLTVTDDLDLIGYFVSDSGTEGISDVDADCFRIYSDNGRIVIEGAEGETTSIYDIMGRNVGNADLPAGVYMVKIGNHPARRVVVIR